MTAYITEDGKLFYNHKDAYKHEKEKIVEKAKRDYSEQLSEILKSYYG